MAARSPRAEAPDVPELSAVTESLSLEPGDSAVDTPGAYLVVAFDGARPAAGAARYSLHGIDEVRIGRGKARQARREGAVLAVELPDAALSSTHAVVWRASDAWRIEDGRSKN